MTAAQKAALIKGLVAAGAVLAALVTYLESPSAPPAASSKTPAAIVVHRHGPDAGDAPH
jgi:hypothetical protein